MTPRCGPCRAELEPVIGRSANADGESVDIGPIWLCPECGAWLPRAATPPPDLT